MFLTASIGRDFTGSADVALAVGGTSPLLVATGNGNNQVFITSGAAVTVLTGRRLAARRQW